MSLIGGRKTSLLSAQPTFTRVFFDTFDGTGATTLPNHTPDFDLAGNGWQSGFLNADMQLSGGGTCYNTTGAFTTDSNTVDVGVSDLKIISNQENGSSSVHSDVFWRVVDTSNYWRIFMDTDNFTVRRRVSAVNTEWGFGSASGSNKITLTHIGTKLKVWFNSTLVLQLNDSNHISSTTVGVGADNSTTTVEIYDFEVLKAT